MQFIERKFYAYPGRKSEDHWRYGCVVVSVCCVFFLKQCVAVGIQSSVAGFICRLRSTVFINVNVEKMKVTQDSR